MRPPGKIRSLAISTLLALYLGAANSNVDAQFANTTSDDTMLELMTRRVTDNPEHSDSWRLLGRIYHQKGNIDKAAEALTKSIELDPENAAAHFDMGELQTELGNHLSAKLHFQKVLAFAPASEYAKKTRARGIEPAAAGSISQTVLPMVRTADYAELDPTLGRSDSMVVGYEMQTFDGAGELNRRIDQITSSEIERKKRLRAWFELGAVYNSNVTLTPISRELASRDAASAQLVFNPDLELSVWQSDQGEAGLLGRGYFTVNESHMNSFDLASLQPGAWFERELILGGHLTTFRAEYFFVTDYLGGSQIGDRHSLTGSMTRINDEGNIDFGFLTFASSDFTDDGIDPSIESLDGTTISAGLSRFFITGSARLPTWSLGVTGESANTDGSDFRYYSFRAHSDATIQINDRWSLIPSSAFGFRNYPDFSGAVSRDELTWRTGIKLERVIKKAANIGFVFNYDRFASDNAEFDVDRFLAGVITTFRY